MREKEIEVSDSASFAIGQTIALVAFGNKIHCLTNNGPWKKSVSLASLILLSKELNRAIVNFRFQ